MPRVLITGSNLPYKDREIQILSDVAQVDIRADESEPLEERIGEYDVILVDTTHITERHLKKATRLRGIVEYGAGTDNIDVEAATRLGIPVCNVPDASTIEVAEHALALAFALARQIVVANNTVKRGVWDFNRVFPVRVRGKVMGIIGLGRIGAYLATSLTCLGCRVLGFDPIVSAERVASLGVEPASLHDALCNSDFVFLCCPLTTDTRGLIGEAELKLMKPGAYLINTSRGALVDERSLYQALKTGHLKGAASDVLVMEPPSRDNPLLSLDSFLCTPHMAWKSEASVLDLEMKAAAEARRILLGEKPLNLVNKNVCGRW